jgi:hypothetical protein
MCLHSLNWDLHAGKWSASGYGRLTPGQDPWYSLSRRLGGPQGWAGRFGEEHNHACRDSKPGPSYTYPSRS